MPQEAKPTANSSVQVVKAKGEAALFKVGDSVRISVRYPVGHYRVPTYMRGKQGTVEMILKPMAVNNEEEGFGRNAGSKGHYYRISVPLTELWPGYAGLPQDRLLIEIFETWLESI